MLVVGSTAFDVVARVASFPKPDEAVRAEAMEAGPGGCGANAARALARLGREPTLLSAVGPDFADSEARAALADEGVDLSKLVQAEAPTARAMMATDDEIRQRIVYHEGATPRMQALDPVEAGIGLFTPGELTAYPRLMAPVDRVVFDPGQEVFYRPIEEVLEPLDAADVLVANEHEVETLANAVGSLAELVDAREAVVVTHPDGQTIHREGETIEVAAVEADVVDPTGAGDAYAAGLVHGLAEGLDWRQASRLGGALAACVIEEVGAQTGLPTLDRARARLGQG